MNIGSVIKPITRNNCSNIAVEFKEVSSAWPISDVNFSTGDGELFATADNIYFAVSYHA